MFKKTQSITLKDTCSPLSNNFTVFIDAKRNVGHYAVVSRNIVTISSSPLEGQSGAKPVNRPFVLRDPSARRISHIVQVSSFFLRVRAYRRKPASVRVRFTVRSTVRYRIRLTLNLTIAATRAPPHPPDKRREVKMTCNRKCQTNKRLLGFGSL